VSPIFTKNGMRDNSHRPERDAPGHMPKESVAAANGPPAGGVAAVSRLVPLEKEVQRAVVKLCRSVGCIVKSTSQARASKVALGLPDLLVFCPNQSAFFFFEVKRPGGKQSAEQAAFERLAVQSGIPYGIGGVGGMLLSLKHVARLGLVVPPGAVLPGDRVSLPGPQG